MENKDGEGSRSYSLHESRRARAWRVASRAEQRQGGLHTVLEALQHACQLDLRPGGREAAFLPKGPCIAYLHRRTRMKGMLKVRHALHVVRVEPASGMEVLLRLVWLSISGIANTSVLR